jgi:hypothetical protein
MDHVALLAELYQAYKTENMEYALVLRDEYPEVFAEVADLVVRADTKDDFDKLLEDLTK